MKYKNRLTETLDMLTSLPPMGTEEYSEHVQELIANLKNVKSTLKSGPDRKNYRKESGNLQRAIEALRYLNRRNQRMLKTEHADISFILREYVDYAVGATATLPRCNLKTTLQRVTNMSSQTASNIDKLFGGFIPYYLCDAAEGLSAEFGDLLISPLRDFKKIIKKAKEIGSQNPQNKKGIIVINSKFSDEKKTRKLIYDKYDNLNYNSFYASTFFDGLIAKELKEHVNIKSLIGDLDTSLAEKAAAIAEDTVSSKRSEVKQRKSAYYQAFARGALNYLIEGIDKDLGYTIPKIKG